MVAGSHQLQNRRHGYWEHAMTPKRHGINADLLVGACFALISDSVSLSAYDGGYQIDCIG